MHKFIPFTFIIFTCLLMHSCASADELRSSPTNVIIDGSSFTLDATVWRDFSPPTSSDGDPMRSTIHLNLISGPEILNQVHLVRQYVIMGDEVWAADLFNLTIGSSTYEGTSENGPKWGPNISVDVVLEFTYNGKSYKILVTDQNIEKVE
jgi:hypothetical protein